ncbi:hypothetical protein DAI22_01g206800 [Oryza sativa Japonica Group]|nr:hypothetical protein DAI22_01g206800 [Oryza sativa Japonica Group]
MARWLVIGLLKMYMFRAHSDLNFLSNREFVCVQKLEKDDKRRLCQWWWRHWNAILVVILDMGIVKARRRWPTFTPCQNWINNDGNSSAGP